MATVDMRQPGDMLRLSSGPHKAGMPNGGLPVTCALNIRCYLWKMSGAEGVEVVCRDLTLELKPCGSEGQLSSELKQASVAEVFISCCYAT